MRGSMCGDGEIRERRIAGNTLGEFDRFGQAGAVIDEILRQPDRLAFFGIERASGQHHVHHAGDAEKRRKPHRATAADEDAAASLRKRVVSRAFRHADMHRGRKLQPAADHRAVQHGDDRHFAELNAFERTMPRTRMRDAAEHVALFKLGEVEAGAEMIAVAGQHDGANFGRQASKNATMPCTSVSFSALRFSARCSRRIATGPRCSARSEEGSLMALKSELTVDC